VLFVFFSLLSIDDDVVLEQRKNPSVWEKFSLSSNSDLFSFSLAADGRCQTSFYSHLCVAGNEIYLLSIIPCAH
jgi:hypothetical protein